jgi:GTP cyclohydrolase II
MELTQFEIEELIAREANHDCAGVGEHKVCVRIVAISDLPTRFGHFQVAGFWNNRDAKEHVAIMKCNPFGAENLLTRVHSSCLTGEGLGSLRCDCRDQLEASLRLIEREGRGIVLYLQQEGRGIGLLNKLKAYELQDRGLDTVEANRALGFRDDEREYSIAAHMLFSLRVKSISLLTNNPRKVEDLSRLGVKIVRRVPHVIPPNEYNRFYLETKAARSGHYIDFSGKPHLQEQGEPVQVEGMKESAS